MRIKPDKVYYVPETHSILFMATRGGGPERWEEIRGADLELLARVMQDGMPRYPQEYSVRKGL